MFNRRKISASTYLETFIEVIKRGAFFISQNIAAKYILSAIIICRAVVVIIESRSQVSYGAMDFFSNNSFYMLNDFILFVVIVLMFSFLLCGNAFLSYTLIRHFQRIGLINHLNECPVLIQKAKINLGYCYKFRYRGLTRQVWEDKKSEIESVLNEHILGYSQELNLNEILIFTVPSSGGLPTKIEWDDEYLIDDESKFIVGKGIGKNVIINLDITPHILIGGSTSSGKTMIILVILYQALFRKNNNTQVLLCDFKGGVDFSRKWLHKKNLIMVTEKGYLLELLQMAVLELEQRKRLLNYYDCRNITEYNKKTKGKCAPLPRIIIACDEVGEMLDKSGLSKDEKETVIKIERYLSTIARLGRAFHISLILSTQRPSADILGGSIKNNLDFRICGRADNVLSQIILDSAIASHEIHSDEQGRFITKDGTLFQAFYFDDEKHLSKL